MLRETIRSMSWNSVQKIKHEMINDFPNTDPPIEEVLAHSGAKITKTICKRMNRIDAFREYRHLRLLGPLAPEVYGTIEVGEDRILVMEYLDSWPAEDMLLHAAQVLDRYVWIKPAPVEWTQSWTNDFANRFGFIPPDWSLGNHCLIHGDPTLANLRWSGMHMRFIDPKTPGSGIPPFNWVDLGKIMQSYLGWERALYATRGRGEATRMDRMYMHPEDQVYPFEGYDTDGLRKIAFWCMVHFMRIVQREGSSQLGEWAMDNVNCIAAELGIRNEVSLGFGWDVDPNTGSEPTGLLVVGDQATS